MPPLGYGTNLHAAESLEDLLGQVVPFAAALRQRLAWPQVGADLRLGFRAIADLGQPAARAKLRRAFDLAGISAHTLNGFPLGVFQAPVVKDAAYRPDWSEPARLEASLALIDLALALSDEPLVTISTVPGCYLPHGPADLTAIARALGTWAAAALIAWQRTGRRVILCLEPEPGCLLAHSAEAAWFWRGPLATLGVAAAAAALDDDPVAGGIAVTNHLGLCFDTCHVALAGEDPVAAVGRLNAAGVPIAKVQASAAPEIDPRDPAALARLLARQEPRFLHQAMAATAGGSLVFADDLDGLPAALARLPGASLARAHFHIPLHAPLPGLGTTAPATALGLGAVQAAGCTHAAVETYTWPLLAGSPEAILAGTAAELAWLAERWP